MKNSELINGLKETAISLIQANKIGVAIDVLEAIAALNSLEAIK
jgi:hypothetical protein